MSNNRDSLRHYGYFLTMFFLGGILFALCGCSATGEGGIQATFDAIGTALIPIAPWAAPALHAIGGGVASLWGTNGVLAASGALVHHHVHFGVTPGRRRKLANKRSAHRAAPNNA